ncbi:MAG: HAD-IA family hydrolase [Clostridia bacterium]|nr:HAD-IA family hydrolase [Clostridia bacterium]
MAIKGILFDLDGTLCNTLFDLAAATNRVITAHGFCEKPVENFKQYVGNGAKMQLKRAIGQEIPNELFEIIHKEYIADYGSHYMDKTCSYDGVEEMVSKLYQKGIRMGVVTNKPQQMATDIVKAIFGNQIPEVWGNTPDFPLKPDPSLPLHVMNRLGLTPEETLFVGDSGIDMETGLNCGMNAVGVTWGFRDREELKKAGANQLIETPAELLSFFD